MNIDRFAIRNKQRDCERARGIDGVVDDIDDIENVEHRFDQYAQNWYKKCCLCCQVFVFLT